MCINPASFVISVALAAGLTAATLPAHADGTSVANAHHTWNDRAVVGQSVLHRSEEGLKAEFKVNANATDPDRVVTLWFIVFNTPEGCATSPCTQADIMNPFATADFLYGGGIVTTGSKAELGGSVATGDNSGSGFFELIAFFEVLEELVPGFVSPFPDDFQPPGLDDASGAEVMLALHSHGPAGSGLFLADQISSYLGGCFGLPQGDDFGFATGPDDVPEEGGECSTVILSIHQP